MNKVSQVKSSIRKERWLSIIKECQSSGMTIRAWCKQNNIKEATYYRKNWLFADTPKGATASAAIYSIIETAKANGLNVYTYLEFLLMWMPDTDWHNHPEDLEDLMPWSEMAQSICKA